MYKVIIATVLLGFVLAACGSYTKPPEDFLSAQIQFAEPAFTRKNISVASFVEFVQGFKIGDRETRIRGWIKRDRNWTLVSESAGEKYEYRFADVLTDRGGNAIVVFQAIYRDGMIQDSTTLLPLIIR